MSVAMIGGEHWDLVDAEGVQTFLPSADAKGPCMRFPTRWRVFGPLKSRAIIAPVGPVPVADGGASRLIEEQRVLPARLEIDGELYPGRDIDTDGQTLDLTPFCEACRTVMSDSIHDAAARTGLQAYAFAELEVQEAADVPFGAGADWWMQWWMDGKPVCDTLRGGNRWHPPDRTHHTFRCRLSTGKHLLAVRVIGGKAGWVLKAGLLTPREEALSAVTVSDRWQFLSDLGEMRPPYRKGTKGEAALDWGHTMAIASDRCLAEETIEGDFHVGLEANAGILFGAQDSGRYYTLQIPRWGQLWRARTLWACLCKADGSGYLRNLSMMLVPHVPCHADAWYHLKVERRGNRIRTWIDGVKGPGVVDDTYGPGRAGVTGFTKYTVRHLKIDGRVVDGSEWRSGDFRGQPWFVPVPSDDRTVLQSTAELLRISDDELMMMLCEQTFDADGKSATRLRPMLSRDNGRTWAPHGQGMRDTVRCAPWGLRWFVPRPGVIRAFELGSALIGGASCPPLPDDALLAWRDSADKGLTWSAPRPCRLMGDWNRDIFRPDTWNHIYGSTRLRDGALLALILHRYTKLFAMVPQRGQGTWGAEFAQPYVSRSEDDGMSWSQPVPMDNAALHDGGEPDGPHGGFSETAFAELPGGRVVAHARPFAAPFMWRTHSDDGGRTWRLVTYEPFSGAGGPQLVCTRSGYLVSVKRGPALCMHLSADGGVNWDEGTIIDYPVSFNGQLLEVEPDVILVVYPESMGETRPSHVRAQLVRIAPDGPAPLRLNPRGE